MSRYRLTCVLQSPIERGTDLANGHGAINLLAVDKHRGRSRNADALGLFHRCLYRTFVLSLDAGLQLLRVHIVLLSLQHRHLIDGNKARTRRFFIADLPLVRVDVIGEIPIGIGALRRQAVRVDSGVGRPGMNLHQRIVLVNEGHAIAIFFQKLG